LSAIIASHFLIVGAVAAPMQTQSTGAIQANSSMVRVDIDTMQVFNAFDGWSASRRQLFRTVDGGQTWSDITPPAATTIEATYFLNEHAGWTVLADAEGHRQLAHTRDGGDNWTSHLIQDGEESGTVVAVQFVDHSHGWIMLRAPSSSNFSRGTLMATSDGGLTWQSLSEPPIAEAFHFNSLSSAWLAGGGDGRLYHSTDGGNSWQKTALQDADLVGADATYHLPQFSNSRDGNVSVLFASTDVAHVATFATHDGGTSWTQQQVRSVPPESRLVNGIVSDSAGIAYVTGRASAELQTVTIGSVSGEKSLTHMANAAITRADFNDQTSGWVLLTQGYCTSFKSGCSQQNRVFSTTDSGKTLTEITPQVPQSTVKPKLVEVSHSLGFDACTAPSASNLRTWFDNSPFRDVNIYIGGSNRGCSQANLSSAWVDSVIAQGWHLIPTWVGPQAPGSSCHSCGKISTDPATAHQQGRDEALAAHRVAADLGLHTPTIIYYDMEQYSPVSDSAVRQFIDGWDIRMHEFGDSAGVYGAGGNAGADYATIPSPPDAVWIANWNGSTSVFGLSGLPDSAFSDHQRIHQYRGGHTETWGGVTLSIDSDSVDGPIADRSN